MFHIALFILLANNLVVNGGLLPLTIEEALEERAEDTGIGAGKPLDDTDYDNAKTIDPPMPGENEDLENAIEHEDGYEGDMILNPEQATAIAEDRMEDLRSASTKSRHKWPKVGSNVQVPYVISSSFSTSDRAKIANAFQEYASKTCLRMVARTTESDYVSVVRESGCWSYVGKQGGVQKLSLGNGCMGLGTIIHEFMHGIGYWHEQSRSDRDTYVTINWDNIKEDNKHNFKKCSSCDTQGHAYDVESVMHYGKTYFTKNGKNTIERKDCPSCSLGQRAGFSQLDIKGINALYSCSVNPVTPTTCANQETSCDYWKTKGYCTQTYVDYMKKNCKKACGLCGSACVNKKSSCDYWKTKGYCTATYVSYMKANCGKSCGFC